MKIISVIFSSDAEKQYLKLKNSSVTNKFDRSLYNSIERTIDLLKQNPHYGIQIRKRQIPNKFLRKYGIENLWR